MGSNIEANEFVLEIKNELSSNLEEVKYGAVSKFQHLVNRFPYPSALDPCFLKMLECFKSSDNYIRLAIFKVCEKCEKDLNKITCTELIASHIVSVMECNDPIARAITLKFLGLFAPMCQENKNIHHVILSQLDSTDLVECQSAIWAAQRYAKLSRSFAARLCPKLVDKLESLTTSTSYKLCFIPLCGYLHHEMHILQQMRSCLKNMMAANQSTELVCALMDALTRLTSFSPIYAAEQLTLLLEHLHEESRIGVSLRVLRNVLLLARKFPHVWTALHFKTMQAVFSAVATSLKVRIEFLQVFCILAASPNVIDSELWGIYRGVALVSMSLNQPMATSQALRLICTLAACSTCAPMVKQQQITLACALVGSALNTNWHLSSDHTPRSLKMGLLHISKLLSTYPHLSSHFITPELFLSIEKEFPTAWQTIMWLQFLCGILCQTLSKQVAESPMELNEDKEVEGTSQLSSVVLKLDLLKLLTCDTVNRLGREDAQRAVLLICALAFRLHQMRVRQGMAGPKALRLSTLNLSALGQVLESSECGDCWLAYRVARMANKFSLHHLAATIYQRLLHQASSAMLRHYFSSLWNMANGFAVLRPLRRRSTVLGEERVELQVPPGAMEEAYNCFLKSKTQLSCFRELKERFLWRFVCVCSQLVHCSYLAHLFVQAISSHSTHELISVGRSFAECGQEIDALLSRSVDADADTLHMLKGYSALCVLVRDTLTAVATPGSTNNALTSAHEFISPAILALCGSAQEMASKNAPSLVPLQISLKELLSQMMSLPFATPRYCFQALQSTEVRIVSIVPQGKSLGNGSILGESVTLVITGMVLQHGARVFRRITHVVCTISVTSTVQSADKSLTDGSFTSLPTSLLLCHSQVVPVHRKVFTLQYVLSRSSLSGMAGTSIVGNVANFVLMVRVQCQEKSGHVWNAGCELMDTLCFGRL